MGLEARCGVVYDGQRGDGRLHLDGETLLFRGTFRLQIPLRDIQKAEAKGTDLLVSWESHDAIFEIGPTAPKWAEKVLHPPTLLDKLGVKPEMKVSAIGPFTAEFLGELRGRAGDVAAGFVKPETDAILVSVERREDLVKLEKVKPGMTKNGALWVVYPKGDRAITQNDVFIAAKSLGLVDVKVASFSPSQTALKFVIPVHKR